MPEESPVALAAAVIGAIAGAALVLIVQRRTKSSKAPLLLLGLLSAYVLGAAIALVILEAPLAVLTIPALVGGYFLVNTALDALANRGSGSHATSGSTARR